MKKQNLQAIKSTFDADGNGTLDESERLAAKEALPAQFVEKMEQKKEAALERFDANDDGELDETERRAAKQAMQNKMGGKMGDQKGGRKFKK